LQVRSSDGRGIWVGQKRFSGKLNLFLLDSEILVVNVLGIEKYLSSVVGSEMPTKWPIEALKAQAIASRTYALKQKGNNLFDIDSTQKIKSIMVWSQELIKLSEPLKIQDLWF